MWTLMFGFLHLAWWLQDSSKLQHVLVLHFFLSMNNIPLKEESEKVGLNLSIQKTKIMASGPITSWEIDEETVETVSDIILGGSKITADGDCSHEIKRHLLLGRKVMTNLNSILKAETLLCQQRSV